MNKNKLRNNKPTAKPKPLNQQESSIEPSSGYTSDEERFEQEVLWCCSQFEKLMSSGKIPDVKKDESFKAIRKLKNPNLPRIRKIQLMKSYFKDYKEKMNKEQKEIESSAIVNFENTPDSANNGLFFKMKASDFNPVPAATTTPFLFNFKDPCELENMLANTKI
ncbi:unnamed protein product [Diamesa hyperborea]